MLKNGTDTGEKAASLKDPRTLAVAGVLTAISVILDMFRLQVTPELRLSLGFTAIAAAAALYGMPIAIPSAVAADIVALMINPTGGYFFGFTVTAAVAAVIYSTFLHRGKKRPSPFSAKELLIRCVFARSAVALFCNIGLNTIWLSIMYGDSMAALLPARAIKNAILLLPESLLMFAAVSAAVKAAGSFGRR